MDVFESFDTLKIAKGPATALCIGVFDGVHLGHQKIIERLVAESQLLSGKSLIITFKNHPKAWIHKTPYSWIQPFEMRLETLAKLGVDWVLSLDFVEAIQKLTAQQFLTQCETSCSFKALILGYDTSIGSDQIHDKNLIKKIVSPWGTRLISAPPFAIDGKIISSQKIRDAIKRGDLQSATRWLNRPYTLRIQDHQLLKNNIDTNLFGVILPPPGSWVVRCKGEDLTLKISQEGRLKINFETHALKQRKESFLDFEFLRRLE